MTRRDDALRGAPPELLAEIARLERVRQLEREIARRRADDPLAFMRWLPGQLAFLACTGKRKLFRAGNQGQGKTTAGAAEVLYRAIGSHPFKQVRPAPTRQWAICASNEQSQIVQRKVWELVPKSLVSPGCVFDHDKGAFLGKYPRLRLRNGSWVAFKTGGGDPANVASETLDHVWFDEPPDNERVYNEGQKRVLRRNGDVSMTFTPVNRPVDYLRRMSEAGKITDLHFRMLAEHLVLSDGTRLTLEDGTPMDQRWIDALIAETSDQEVPVVIHGGWEFRLSGAYFGKVWNPATMVREAPTGSYWGHLGLDFGDQPGKQIGLYILVDEDGGTGGRPRVHVDDEYVGVTGAETNEDDARGVLAMLKRRGTSWPELRAAMADRAHRAGRADQKSAADLSRAVCRELAIPDLRGLEPPIWVAKKGEGRGAGSVAVRWRWLHAQMARGNFTVHPRCERLIAAIPRSSPWLDNDAKDPIDALAYGVDRYTFDDNAGEPQEVGIYG